MPHMNRSGHARTLHLGTSTQTMQPVGVKSTFPNFETPWEAPPLNGQARVRADARLVRYKERARAVRSAAFWSEPTRVGACCKRRLQWPLSVVTFWHISIRFDHDFANNVCWERIGNPEHQLSIPTTTEGFSINEHMYSGHLILLVNKPHVTITIPHV